MLYSLRHEKETEVKKIDDTWLEWLDDQEPFEPDRELPRQWREAYDDMLGEAA